jgi:hypothetical protein
MASKSCRISSLVSKGNLEVFTPQISTLLSITGEKPPDGGSGIIITMPPGFYTGPAKGQNKGSYLSSREVSVAIEAVVLCPGAANSGAKVKRTGEVRSPLPPLKARLSVPLKGNKRNLIEGS